MANRSRKKIVWVIPPLKRLLGFENRVPTPGIGHDVALLQTAGHEVWVINADAAEAPLPRPSFKALFEASKRLENADFPEVLNEAARLTVARVAEHAPDVVVVPCGDWVSGAKDYFDPTTTIRVGELLRGVVAHTVVCGVYPTLAAERFVSSFDAVVTGVPGHALGEAVRGQRGVLSGGGTGPYVSLVPETARMEPASSHDLVVSEFGCPYGRCKFCPVSLVYGPGVTVTKDADAFISDVGQAGRADDVYIVDSYFGHDLTRLQILAPALQELGKAYTVDARTEVAQSPATLELYRAMGVKRLNLGVEALATDSLRTMNKGQTGEAVVESLRTLCAHGFAVRAYILLGMPGNSHESMRASLEAARDLADQLPNVEWFPNVFCDRRDQLDHPVAHHFSEPQSRRVGVPPDVLAGWIQLADQSRALRSSTPASADRERRVTGTRARGLNYGTARGPVRGKSGLSVFQ